MHKPAAAPAVLLTDGATETARMRKLYAANRVAYRSGAATFEFLREIYGHPDVKSALWAAQQDKCAFCEAKIRHVSYGDVEHFRPKAGYRQKRSGALKRPGYFWLAYDWSNLVLACQLCNQRHKRNLFPLVKGSPRARGPSADVGREIPLFINPAQEDPAPHLGFNRHVAIPRGATSRGRRTIRGLGLNRSELRAHREEFLRRIAIIFDLARGHPRTSQRKKARDFLRNAMRPAAEYSAMVRDYLQGRGFTG